MASTAQPALECRDAYGRTLEEAELEDRASRNARAAGFQAWVDRIGYLRRNAPLVMLVPVVVPLAFLFTAFAATLLIRALGFPDLKVMIWWADLTPHVQRALQVVILAIALTARWMRRRLLVQARLEGLEVRDPEEPAEPEPES